MLPLYGLGRNNSSMQITIHAFFYNKDTNMIVLLYVDDLWMDAMETEIDDFVINLRKRFQCKELQKLKPGQPLDYLGMEVAIDSTDSITIGMPKYTDKLVVFMGLDSDRRSHSPVDCPYTSFLAQKGETEDLSELNRAETKTYLTACIGYDRMVSGLLQSRHVLHIQHVGSGYVQTY